MPIQKPIPGNVAIAFHNLVWHFIKRRFETVIPALVELRPDIILQLELTEVLNADLEDVKKRSFLIRRQLDEGSFLWSGIWNNEWGYRLHGLGCELVHLHTDEKFDWDAQDPYIFYTGELGFYLYWRIHHSADKVVGTYLDWLDADKMRVHDMRQFTLPLLEHLVEQEILATRYSDEWKLIKFPV